MEFIDLWGKLSLALSARLNDKDSYSEYFSAAVLVPLIWENDEIAVLFEVRSAHLSWQPGEICFPGGHIEDSDDNPLVTAVRETTEELGLSAEHIQVLGALHEVISPIGVRLYPFVGYIHDAQHINANPDEVAEIFAVPLDLLVEYEPIVGHMERCTRPLANFPIELLPGYSKNGKDAKIIRCYFISISSMLSGD